MLLLYLTGCWRIDAFQLWCCRRLFRVPWTARRSNQSKRNQSWIFIGKTDTEAEALILWPPDVKRRLIRKDPNAGKDWGQEEKQVAEDKMVGWHHWLNGRKFEQTLGDSEGQGSLACCSPWGCRVGHNLTTEKQQAKRAKRSRGKFSPPWSFWSNWLDTAWVLPAPGTVAIKKS